jgi:transcription initiation factor TFIIH subunit 3
MTASGTTASHYMSYMNVFFTAQKLNILIDACMLDRDSGLLQQEPIFIDPFRPKKI